MASNNRYNLCIVQGSTFSTNLTLTNSDGSVIDLTSYTVTGQIRYNYTSNVLLGLNPYIYSAVSGIVRLTISGSQTAALPCGTFVYDLELRNSSDESVFKPLMGYTFVQPEVTK